MRQREQWQVAIISGALDTSKRTLPQQQLPLSIAISLTFGPEHKWNVPAAQALTLIDKRSVWTYLDNGSNQGTAWRAASFNDATWASGAGQLGYGDGDEATVVRFGPNASTKYTTTYFRKAIPVDNPALFTSLLINLLRDDGAVVYLNGVELARSNMPTGTVSSSTRAPSAVGAAAESTYYPFTVNTAALRAGVNVIAVEIHQSAPDSSDLSFDLELIARP